MTKEEAFNILDQFPRCTGCDDTFPFKCNECDEAFYTALMALKQQDIVLCKDCMYYEPTPAKDEPDRGWCNGRCSDLPAVHGDWFCADGKGGEQDG